MKVTTKTVQDRITILENQKVISINESNTLSMLKWALEQQQRAEAAEAECTRLDRESQTLSDQLGSCDRERRDLLSKLAELEKQKPVGTVSISMDWNTHRNIATVNMRPDLVVAEMKNGDELFTRPAPAASLAELVPESRTAEYYYEKYPEMFMGDAIIRAAEWEMCRDAILRNIEEKSRG